MRNSKFGRFKLFDLSTDRYNHNDVAENWDRLDKIIGGNTGNPGSSSSTGYNGTPDKWLGAADSFTPSGVTTQNYPGTGSGGFASQTTGTRTLYSVVAGLNYNDVPLGAVIAWWRPHYSVPLPDGWAPCDGAEYRNEGSAIKHSYPGLDSIRVPDLRNKFVLGAFYEEGEGASGIDATNGKYENTPGAYARSEDNTMTTAPQGNAATGAPGIGYDSGLEPHDARTGSNELRNIAHSHAPGTYAMPIHKHTMDHTHAIEAHTHAIPQHMHGMDHVHVLPDHTHEHTIATSSASNFSRVATVPTGTGGSVIVSESDHNHTLTIGKRRKWTDATAGRYSVYNVISSNKTTGFINNGSLWWTPTAVDATTSNYYTATGYDVSAYSSRAIAPRLQTFPEPFAYLSGWDADLKQYTDLSPSGTATSANTGSLTTLASSKPYTGEIAATSIIGTSQTAGQTDLNVRPQYVGLLYIIKIRVSTNLI